MENLLTIKQVSEILGVSTRWIFKLIKSGKLTPIKIGGNIRCGMNLIPRNQIEKLIKDKAE